MKSENPGDNFARSLSLHNMRDEGGTPEQLHGGFSIESGGGKPHMGIDKRMDAHCLGVASPMGTSQAGSFNQIGCHHASFTSTSADEDGGVVANVSSFTFPPLMPNYVSVCVYLVDVNAFSDSFTSLVMSISHTRFLQLVGLVSCVCH